jgi:Tat protein secretion system quality control protein TatD with DNase activity
VPYVAQLLAELRGISAEGIGELTSANFDRLFYRVTPSFGN